jgi:NAD(P)-dependent dehydrogenase (short-subunit alcohol dehydrogenase family)
MSLTRKLIAGAAFAAGAAWAYRLIVRRSRWVSFRERIAVITGGSRGLGLVIARQLAAEGARLAILARDEDELERAVQDLAARGAEVVGIPCDVTDQSRVDVAIEQVINRYHRIDLLINNAGTSQVGPFDHMKPEDFEYALGVHVRGPLYTILAALPHMRDRGQGRIVNISSVGGEISVPHLLPYSTSKFALVGLSEGLRSELSRDNIFVTTICPGLVRSGSIYNANTKGRHSEEFAWFGVADSMPINSMSAEETARQILDATRHGDARLTTTPQAKVAVAMHALFPELVADVAALVTRLLPKPTNAASGDRNRNRKGHEVRPSWLPSIATRLSDKAAQKNNQMPSALT